MSSLRTSRAATAVTTVRCTFTDHVVSRDFFFWDSAFPGETEKARLLG